jgi:hypothetical protein
VPPVSSAITNFVSTDLIAAPLLWIGPLGIYLATLIAAFGGRGPAIARRLAWLVPIVVVLLVVPFAAPTDWPVLPLLAIEYLGFGVIGLVLHGQLAADRPPPERLTAFYLVVAAGGALGGAFVGLLAPAVFPGVWEYPILLVAALAAMAVSPDLRAAAAAPVRRKRPRSRIVDLAPATAGATRRLTVYFAIAGLVGVLLTLSRSISLGEASTWLLIGAASCSAATSGSSPWRRRRCWGHDAEPPSPCSAIALFGSPRCPAIPPDFNVLRHGTTVHSLQATSPALRREPAGYFSRVGPLGDVVARLDERLEGGPRRTIVTGLGAGTIAAYQRPGDAMTFIEIDPLMERVAADPSLFSYCRSPGCMTIVTGDGPELERQADGAADPPSSTPSRPTPPSPLILPRRCRRGSGARPRWVLAVNISSRYYALGPAVAAGVEPLGLTVLERLHDPTAEENTQGITTSDWLVATRDPADVAWFEGRGWSVVEPASEPLTDDRSDLLRLLRPDMLW